MCYYAADKDALKKASSDILAIMGTGRDGLLEILSPTKKHSILFKIANKYRYEVIIRSKDVKAILNALHYLKSTNISIDMDTIY